MKALLSSLYRLIFIINRQKTTTELANQNNSKMRLHEKARKWNSDPHGQGGLFIILLQS